MRLNHVTALLATTFVLAACGDKVDDAAKAKLKGGGFSEEAAAQLSAMNLNPQEQAGLLEARNAGLDPAAAVDIVKTLHDRDLRFDIGTELRLMLGDSMSSTALVQLTQIGAIPRWADDIRSLREAGVGDVTIIEIAKMKFEEKKELLSGGEYARLKKRNMSDAGLLTFIRKGGTAQQAQAITLAMDLGKSEQEAMKEAGL